jgi:hypothetical protein
MGGRPGPIRLRSSRGPQREEEIEATTLLSQRLSAQEPQLHRFRELNGTIPGEPGKTVSGPLQHPMMFTGYGTTEILVLSTTVALGC